MPAFLETHRIHRRAFLKSAMAGAAVLALRAPSLAAEKEFHVALISDTHIPADVNEAYRNFKPVENLKRIIPEIVEAKPELTLHCGDVARTEGKLEDYQQLAELLKPLQAASPVCMTLGNHDDRANFNTVFKAVAGEKQKVAGKNTLVIEHEVARLIVLDSLMYVNKVAGQLGKAQRTWLAEYLKANADRPAILFVHHTLTDADGDLVDVDRMFEVLKAHAHVKAIFFGHSHVWATTERQGVKLINLPAVGYNFANKDPVGWVDAKFYAGGVRMTLRAFAGNTSEDKKVFDVKWG